MLSSSAMALWAAAIIGVFMAVRGDLVRPTLGSLGRIAAAGLSVWAFWFTGWRLWRRRGGSMPAAERSAYEIGSGAAVAIGAVFLLGIAQLYHPGFGLALVGGLLIGPQAAFWRELRGRFAGLAARGERVFVAIAAAAGAMTLLESLAPATAQDALVYHLAVPDLYVRRGGIVHVPENFFASFPQNVEMLFTLALLIGDARLAGVFHWLLGAGAALGAGALALRIAERPGAGGGAGGAWTATALFASIPTTALIAGWAYVDLGLVFYQLLALLAFLRWWSGEGRSWLALSGFFTGMAGGCKYTGGAIGVVLGALIVVEAAARRRLLSECLCRFGLFAAVAVGTAGPWFAKNAILTGNPIFPFLHEVFRGRFWDAERALVLGKFLGGWGEARGPLEVLALPWTLTFRADFFSIERFDGVIGAAFLAGAPLVVLACRWGAAARLVLAAALGLAAIWLVLTQQIRFLLPALACLAAIIGAALSRLEGRLAARAIQGAIALACAFNVLTIGTHFAAHDPVPVVFGLETEDEYLAREIPGGDYAVFAHINSRLEPDARVLFAACGNPGFLVRRDYHMDAIFENRTLKRILAAGRTPAGVDEEMRRGRFSHLLFRGELVFDPAELKSDLPLALQVLLQDYLNHYARLEAAAGGTLLYRLGAGPSAAEGPRADRGREEGS
jgi:hypothetical protein